MSEAEQLEAPLSDFDARQHHRELVGVDFCLQSQQTAEELAERLQSTGWQSLFELTMISNRGVQIWPEGNPGTLCTDHWSCRFLRRDGAQLRNQDILKLAIALDLLKVDVVKTEHLYEFDGKPGYTGPIGSEVR